VGALTVQSDCQITTAYIGLGGNLGDTEAIIRQAIQKLSDVDGILIEDVSAAIRTAALGDAIQPDYTNAVVKIITKIPPSKLYRQMALIEDSLGRVRREKWAPRTIDLDLLLYGGEIIECPNLVVPHSQMHVRSFVLDGMCRLAPNLAHPVLKRTMTALAGRLNGNDFAIDPTIPQLISVAGVIGVGKTTLANELGRALGCKIIHEAYDTNPYIADVYAGRKDLALDSQLYFLTSRGKQLDRKGLTKGDVLVADYVFDKDMIFAKRTLGNEQLREYERRFRKVRKTVAAPVLTIYLEDLPKACLERIYRRNRPYEQKIQLQTLSSLANDYKRLFADWNQSPLIRIDVSEFDCQNSGEVNTFAGEVKNYICT